MLVRVMVGVAALVALLMSLLVVPGVASAATFTVTSTSTCSGPGTFVEAVRRANQSPGTDTIRFAAGLGPVHTDLCFQEASQHGSGELFMAQATESLVIQGPATFVGASSWISASGHVNPDLCPKHTAGAILVGGAPGLLQVGTAGSGNIGIEATINDVQVEGTNSVTLVESGAAATFTDSAVRGLVNPYRDCNAAPFDVQPAARLTLERTRVENSVSLQAASFLWQGVISAGKGSVVEVSDSQLVSNRNYGAILAGGTASDPASVTVVSSQLHNTGGILATQSNANIVNTALSSPDLTEAVYEGLHVNGGNLQMEGSTVYGYAWATRPTEAVSTSVPLFSVTGGATALVAASAVGPFDLGGVKVPTVSLSGAGATTFTDSWIGQVGSSLNPAVPGVSEAEPGLDRLQIFWPATVTPALGTPSAPGTLIDVIPDGCTSNPLVDPLTGADITTDVLGNPRCDAGNGRRNIGAVQLTLAPILAVDSTGDEQVRVSWNRPMDPSSGAVTGYALSYRPVGGGTWQRLNISGATTLSQAVTGLSNGVEYEFQIVAVNSVGDGPPSNTTTATPLGPIGTPTPQATAGDAHVSLTWPQPATGGHSIGGYVVKYREAGSATWTDFGQVSGRSATVTHLKNGTKYEFGVTAVATDGATSSIGTTTASPSAPSKPIGTPKVTATAGNSEVALTWTEPDLGGRTLKNYTVLQRQIGETVWTTVGTTKKNTATVTGLTNGVKYEFAVIVTTTNGATSAPGIATAKPHADKKLKTTLKVKARPKAKKLPLGDRTKVVKKVKTNGLIKKVKLTCSLQGHALKGKNKRHMCTTKKKINTSRTNARVWLTPKCSTGLKVQVRIVAKLPGAKKRTWQRSYRPKKHPRTVCSLHGNG